LLPVADVRGVFDGSSWLEDAWMRWTMVRWTEGLDPLDKDLRGIIEGLDPLDGADVRGIFDGFS